MDTCDENRLRHLCTEFLRIVYRRRNEERFSFVIDTNRCVTQRALRN